MTGTSRTRPRGEGRVRGAQERVQPDLVLTHTRDDLHQDHRLVCELTWNTFRDHIVLEYEIPKCDGDIGTPNVFVPVSEDLARRRSTCSCGTSRPSAASTGSTPRCFAASCDCGGWNAARRAGTPRRSSPASVPVTLGSEGSRHRPPRLHRLGPHPALRRRRTRGHRARRFLYRGCDFGPTARLDACARARRPRRDADDLTGFDAVVHLAALSNDPIGDLNPAWTYDINLDGSRRARAPREGGGRRPVRVRVLVLDVRRGPG